MNEVNSARFTSIAAFLRPVAAIAAGFVADRLLASKVIGTAFVLLLLSYAMLSFLSPAKLVTNIIYGTLIVTFIAVFGIRGVYFALLEETNVAKNLTGTAVGLISLIGFTPDIFFAPIAGRLLDAAPGVAGHHHFFMLLTIISAIGMAATVALAYSNKRTQWKST
jgi:nitrate/nitrite transporter NarK